MKTKLITAILYMQVLFISCGKTENVATNELTADEISIETRDNQSVSQASNDEQGNLTNHDDAQITEVLGDLDKDGVDEKVVVANTSQEGDLGIERRISIYKLTNNSWQLWHESQGAVLPNKHGGMMGEPFDGITIENGCIVINHSGGSRSKWSYTHRYRYQDNNWYLIGATIGFGEPACNWDTFDYNLITGKVEVEKYKNSCEEELGEETTSKYTTKIKIDKLPLMDGFYPGETEVQISEQSDTFYY